MDNRGLLSSSLHRLGKSVFSFNFLNDIAYKTWNNNYNINTKWFITLSYNSDLIGYSIMEDI